MTSQPIIITNVALMKQRHDSIYIFSLSASDLLKHGRIEHFFDNENGVQRQQRVRKVDGLLKAMSRPETIFVESIIVYLAGGEWTYSDSTLVGPEGGYLSVDDGQHRLAALRRLDKKQLKEWAFPVHAIDSSLDRERRIAMFLQQEYGAPLDARLRLSMRHHVGEWANDIERDAYEICLKLATDDDSVLKNSILIGELEYRPRENHGAVSDQINVKGLHTALVKAKQGNSPLNQLSVDDQAKVIKTYLRAISVTWKGSWNSSKQTLSTSRGIGALLMMFRMSPQFIAVVGVELTEAKFAEVLSYMKTYSWSIAATKNVAQAVQIAKLDETIKRSIDRSTAQKAVIID